VFLGSVGMKVLQSLLTAPRSPRSPARPHVLGARKGLEEGHFRYLLFLWFSQ